MLAQELLHIGLNEKEANIYLTTLQLGYGTIQDIADRSKINRTTAYGQIKSMISKGLINTVVRGGKIFYIAEKPEKLQFIYEQKEKEIRRKRELLDQILPELESIYNLAKDKPSVKFFHYEDPSDLLNMREELELFRARELYNIFNYEKYRDFIDKKHLENLLAGADRYKALYISKNKVLDLRLHEFLNDERFFIKHLPVAKFDFICELLMADDRVYIARETDALMIQDRLFSQTLALLFHSLWGLAEEF